MTVTTSFTNSFHYKAQNTTQQWMLIQGRVIYLNSIPVFYDGLAAGIHKKTQNKTRHVTIEAVPHRTCAYRSANKVKSDIDVAVEASRNLEKMLVRQLGGKGEGLVKILESIDASTLPKSLAFLIRQIAHARNGVVHGNGKLGNRKRFEQMVLIVEEDLKKRWRASPPAPKKTTKPKRPKVLADQTKPERSVKPPRTPVRELPEDFDPYVVDLKFLGSFGSEAYDHLRQNK
jgi:uncharacterized protein YutE (UPF0331/DUF86 family)